MDLTDMKKIIISTLLSSTILSAQAANFNGPYVGANVGYSWGESKTHTTTTYLPGQYFFPSSIDQINRNGSSILTLNNFVGGIQTGYNYQNENLLIGVEIDLSYLGSSDSNSRTRPYIIAPPYTFNLYTKTQVDWLVTLRPRIGYATCAWIAYITGGLAFADIKTENNFSDNYFLDPFTPSNAHANSNRSANKTGGVIGGGIEYALTENLLIKAEYLYVKFNNAKSSSTLYINPTYLAALSMINTNSFKHTADYKTNLFRLGINYKFC